MNKFTELRTSLILSEKYKKKYFKVSSAVGAVGTISALRINVRELLRSDTFPREL